MDDYIPYDVEDGVSMSDKSLGAILRAVVRTKSKILDSFEMDCGYKHANRNPVMFRVHVPPGSEKQFEEIAGVKLVTPPTVIGM